MSAFNPLECAKRLEAAGIARPHAEAIAAEINAVRKDRVTGVSSEQLDAVLDRLTIRLSILALATVSMVCIILGVVLSNVP